MSAFQRIGALAWVTDKLNQVADAGEIALNATDAATREQAAFDAATKLAEVAAIGIPLWFLDRALTKTGLDRVFDSLKKNKSFEEYLKNQIAEKNLRDFGIGNIAEWGLKELREWISENGYLDPIFDLITRKVISASSIPSPIALDLDYDGVETTFVTNGALFDHARDGFAELTAWISPDDGLLAHDLNNDGIIDSGRELFGSETFLRNGLKAANGFEALRELDANGDGTVEASDAAFTELRVWQDSDGDGYTSEGELLTLREAGVKSIDVSYTNSSLIDAQGNAHKQISSYTSTAGNTHIAADVWVQTDPTYSVPTEWVEVPEDITALPDAQGYGKVRDLQQAMAMDDTGELKALVQSFTQATTPQDRDALVTELIYHWTGVQDVNPASRTSKMIYGNAIGDARKLEALEEFMGQEWVGVWCWGTRDPNPHGRAAPVLLQAWGELKALVYGQLMAQTHLQGLFQQISYSWDEELEEVVGDLTGVAQVLAQEINAERIPGLDTLGDFLYSLKGMGLLDRLNVGAFKAQLGALGSDVVATMDSALQGWVAASGPSDSDDILRGTDLDDLLDGRSGNDRLLGRGGNDTLIGGAGNDVLEGAAGNDNLSGGTGSDTYQFGRGDGHDTITEDSWATGETDRIQLKAGLTVQDVRLERVQAVVGWQLSDDLLLTIRDTGETITVKNHFSESQRHGLEAIVFPEGTVWNAEAIRSRVLLGEAGDEDLQGFDGRNDLIKGGGGDDRLRGRSGNDTLDGEAGNDLLEGGEGSDRYRFGRGEGHDTIAEDTWTTGETDRIELKPGISPADVRLQRIRTVSEWTASDDLLLTIRDTGETLTVKNHFNYSQRHAVEAIVFSDGTVWDSDAIRARVLLGEAEDETLQGFAGRDNVIGGGAGNDRLLGMAGNDSLDGGTGNDSLDGGQGADTYRFGRGDGVDTIADNSWTAGEMDRIQLKDGLSVDDVRLQRVRSGSGWQVQDNLVLTIRDTGETLTVKNHFNQSNQYAVEEIVFADGTVWDADAIRARVLLGEMENEDLQGFSGRDNFISGGAGDDRLRGRLDQDTLEGGTGNDLLAGAGGSDTYRYQLGDGVDRIDESWEPADADVLQLGDGINPADVHLRWTSQRDLRVEMPEGGQIIVARQATPMDQGSGMGIESIQFADGTRWDLNEMYARTAQTTPGDDDLVLGVQDDVVDGGPGNDRFTNLHGQDTFVFGLGDGSDVINPTQGTLRFKPGVGQNDVRFERDGADVVATITASGDSVRLKEWANSWFRIERFEFDNGTVFGSSEVQALLAAGDDTQLLFGSPGADVLTTSGARATVYAGDGNDLVEGMVGQNELRGEAGDDTLTGGAGDDSLYGGEGDDVLEGGAGRDWLQGDVGNNTYVMRRGMGLDTVRAQSLVTTLDVVLLPEGIRPQDITVGLEAAGYVGEPQPGDSGFARLVIGIGQNDALVIEGFDSSTNSTLDLAHQAVQTFRFSDGTELTLPELLALGGPGSLGVQFLGPQSGPQIWGSAGDDEIFDRRGQASTRTVSAGDNDDQVVLGGLDQVVSGGWGSDDISTQGGADVVAGDAGDDVLRTGSQDDVVLFNRGDGHDRVDFGNGADTLSFGPSIQPENLSVTLSPEGEWLLLVDGGAGGSVKIQPINLNDQTNTDSLRLQFISATGEARIFDFTAWVERHALALEASTAAAPLAFDGAQVEITDKAAMAGGLAAVVHAQTGDLFGTASVARAAPSDGDDLIHGTDGDDAIDALAGNDRVLGHGGNDSLLGSDGDDLLSGGDGDDALEGGTGNDLLLGDTGSDVLWGGGGTDVLRGGMGGDTYRFELGDGAVNIEDGHELIEGLMGAGSDDDEDEGSGLVDGAPNVLTFGMGIRPEDLVYTEVGNDLVITLNHSPQDRLVLKGFDAGRATLTRSVDVLRFQDGTEVVELNTDQMGVTRYASDDGERLRGTPQSDQLVGGEGDDELLGEGGPDRLVGGVGSDEYHVDASSTPDVPTQTVIAETWREQDSNVLFIYGDVSGNDLWLALEGDDLVLRMGQGGDSVRFVGFDPRLPGMPAPVERIELWNTDEAVQFSDLLALGVYDPQAEPADLVVNVGDGAIDIDIGSAAYEAGSVAFGDGIDPGDLQSQLTFEADGRGGHWLVLNYGEPGDVLRLSGFDPEAVLDGGHAIDRFEFANGVVLDYATLVSEGFLVEGNAQADTLRGTNVVDRLFGNDGSDALDGGAGSDELHGGRGQDQLTGGEGDDAYVFHLGDGVDSLIDSGSTGFNFIRFGAGIRPEDIRQAWDGTTLVVHYSDADTVRIVDYRGMDGNPAILALVFDDGQVRSLTEETNRAPELTDSLPNATAMEDAVFQMVLPTDLFRDLDAADELRLTIRRSDGSPLPAWLSFNAERRILSGRPDSDDLGVMQLVVEARDHFGASVSTGFSLNVLSEPTGHENKAPVAVHDTATLLANTTEPATGNVLANDTDPDGETLSLLSPAVQRGILGVIGWQADGAYTYLLNDLLPEVRALAAGQTATDSFAYTVTDGQAQAQGNLLITVQGVNDAPTSQQPLGNRLVIKKETSTWSVPASAFTDPDQGDSLSYSAALAGGAALPAWMVFDAASRSFVAKPPASAKGELSVKVTATDLHGATASQVFQVRVGNPGDKPKGNEGLGNGEDPPPPGHDTDFNDGPGTGPGNPGASEGRHAQPAVPVEALQTAMNPAPVELVDWAAWDTPQEPATASNAPTSGDVDIEHHWQQLLATLQQLDAQRSANDFWSDPNQSAGFGLTGLAAGDSQVGLSGASAVGLTAGCGTHLASFSGLKEGLTSLA